MPKSLKRAHMTFNGLCATCSNDPVCTFPRKPQVSVMDCLEFEGENLEEDHGSSPAAQESRRRSPAPPAHEPGLCFWCEHKTTCTFPKSPGGVWSCEEFA